MQAGSGLNRVTHSISNRGLLVDMQVKLDPSQTPVLVYVSQCPSTDPLGFISKLTRFEPPAW